MVQIEEGRCPAAVSIILHDSILMNEISQGMEPAILAELDAARGRYLDFMSGVLEEGQRRGYLAPGNVRLTAVAIMGMLDALCNQHLRDPQGSGRDDLVATMRAILRGGIVRG